MRAYGSSITVLTTKPTVALYRHLWGPNGFWPRFAALLLFDSRYLQCNIFFVLCYYLISFAVSVFLCFTAIFGFSCISLFHLHLSFVFVFVSFLPFSLFRVPAYFSPDSIEKKIIRFLIFLKNLCFPDFLMHLEANYYKFETFENLDRSAFFYPWCSKVLYKFKCSQYLAFLTKCFFWKYATYKVTENIFYIKRYPFYSNSSGKFFIRWTEKGGFSDLLKSPFFGQKQKTWTEITISAVRSERLERKPSYWATVSQESRSLSYGIFVMCIFCLTIWVTHILWHVLLHKTISHALQPRFRIACDAQRALCPTKLHFITD